ncbi:MAG: protein kinase [Planctomycetota bacterium]|nr:protein kinase [Planctomycetota bacterium]
MSTPNPHSLPAGFQVGNCRITEKLGLGGGGVVYKAIQDPLDREVAVKILAPQQVKRGIDYVSRFLHEAKMAARLHHPNIVDVYDAGEDDGLYYIVMEYVRGNSIDRLLKGGQIVDMGFWLNVMSQACQALVESHGKGVIHRDIKPANMLLDARNSVKLTDFGLAVWAEGGVKESRDVAGTPYYMPPEVMNDMPLDARSDIYSLGATFFHCLTGRFLFQGESPMIVILKHAKDSPVSIKECRPELPDAICELIMSMIRKDPNDRPQSMHAILMNLQSLNRSATLNEAAPISPEDMPPTLVERPAVAATPALDEISSSSAVLVGQEGRFKARRFSVAINGITTVGRLNDNDIALPDETISRHHCTIEAKDKKFMLQDRGSSNGCRINGEKISEEAISAGDSVRIGKVDFKFFVMAVSEDAYQLAEILVQNGLLSPREAKNALNELAHERNRKGQRTLGQILVERGKVSSGQLEESLDNLDRNSRRHYTARIRMVRRPAGPAAPTRGNPIPDALGGKKTGVIRKPDFEKPMPPPSGGDELSLLEDVAPPPPRPGRPPKSPAPYSPEPPPPEPAPVPDFSKAELSLDDDFSPSPQSTMSLADEGESDAATMSGFAGTDSLFGQMSVCSGCKEIIMMSDVSSGEAMYMNSKLFCKKCATAS